MAASPCDSAIFGELFGDAELAALFDDDAVLRSMLRVEAALAAAQAAEGLIPEEAAVEIGRMAEAARIEPAALAAGTARDGVPVPALLAGLRAGLTEAAAGWLHWGATSQDIVDTGLMLRLRPALALLDARLRALTATLGGLAEAHAQTPMAGRSYGQVAVPTSFGAVIAGWGWPLIAHAERLEALRRRLLCVSLGGAAGTLSAMGGRGAAVRARLAGALDLADPGHSWHGARDAVAELAGWTTGLTVALGRMGEDVWLMTQSGIEELRLAGGGSSTMPHKNNPVGPSVLVALARAAVALNSGLQGAALHRQQRDGGAWFTEWLLLPQVILGSGRALATAQQLLATLTPDPARMAANLEGDLGLIHAEALTFALARHMPRPAAQARISELCAEARATATPLPQVAARELPDLPSLGPDPGEAPAEARRFAAAARTSGG
jgi:3-carboxy-cis,cis-muconate cycloisomerase